MKLRLPLEPVGLSKIALIDVKPLINGFYFRDTSPVFRMPIVSVEPVGTLNW